MNPPTFNDTLTVTYKLDADTTTSALLSLIRVDKNTAGVVVSTDTKVIRITPTGSQKLLTDTETDASSSLIVIYQ
ncbi:hypothetical protein [Limnohabitans sp.]|uniref:hypothetical protein n=1 Tax=Limnohabitans sp. TaxID=1907725 RepID=UPI00286F7942|nr:hypothetical protein [Limnohabitans sp.]